jgi:DNA polymerase-3 subunit epsilon
VLEQGFEHSGSGRWPESAVALHVETTGGRSERQRILFIGLTRVVGGRIEQSWETLVNPLARVPLHVVRRLDLDLESLDASPAAPEVLEDVRATIGDDVVVAHGALAQLGPLNYELLWHGLPPLRSEILDTQSLATRRLPDLARPSLDAIARRLGVPSRERASHGPHGVSRLVAEVYLALTEGHASDAAGAAELDDVPSLARAYATPAGAAPAELPALPGVYTFRDTTGAPLYIGKATSLKSRVPQHFTGGSRAVRLDDGLLVRTSYVEHEVTPTEREARRRELALIAELAPPYNTQRTAHRGTPWLVLRDPPFLRVAASATRTEEQECFGPYATTRAVRETMRTLAAVFQLRTCLRRLPAKRKAMRVPCLRLGMGQCPAPCGDLADEVQYARRIELARTFLREGKLAALDQIDILCTRPLPGWEHALLAEVRSRLLRVSREHRPI